MEDTNPQIEASLEALASICCDSVNGESDSGFDRTEALLKSLLMSGYNRIGIRPMQVELETRARQRCAGLLPHKMRGISDMSEQIASQFSNLARKESKTPSNE